MAKILQITEHVNLPEKLENSSWLFRKVLIAVMMV